MYVNAPKHTLVVLVAVPTIILYILILIPDRVQKTDVMLIPIPEQILEANIASIVKFNKKQHAILINYML
jgi:hypothetical protein